MHAHTHVHLTINKLKIKFLKMVAELSERERITILMMRGWDANERSYSAIVRLFNDTYPNCRINNSTVLKTIKRFREPGSVKNRSKSGRPSSAINEEQQLDVLHLLKIPTLVLIKSLKLTILLPCRFGEF